MLDLHRYRSEKMISFGVLRVKNADEVIE